MRRIMIMLIAIILCLAVGMWGVFRHQPGFVAVAMILLVVSSFLFQAACESYIHKYDDEKRDE